MPLPITIALWILITPLMLAQSSLEYPDPLDREELDAIIEMATTDGDLPGRLAPGHIFRTPTSCESSVEVPNEKVTVQKIKLQSKASGGEYLVIARSDDQDKLIFTDIIRHHDKSNLYHRWRLFADPKSPILFFYGDFLEPVSPADRRKRERNAEPIEMKLTWREFDRPTGQVTASFFTIVDSYLNLKNGGKGFVSISIEYRKGRWIRREVIKKFEFKSEPMLESAKKDEGMIDGLLGRLLKKDKQEVESKTHTFEDLNFSYAIPSKDYKSIDMTRVNPNANLFFSNPKSMASFMIMATNGTQGFSAQKQVIEVIRAQATSQSKLLEESEITTVKVDGVPFEMASFLVESPRGPSCYTVLCMIRNGYLVQLIHNQPGITIKEAQAVALSLSKGYKFLDPNKKAEGASISKASYLNPSMGITFDPVNVGGRFWSPQEMKMQFPSADFGVQFGLDQAMFIIPLDLNDFEPNDQALSQVMLFEAGVDLNNDVTKTTPISQGSAAGTSFEARKNLNGSIAHYRIRLLKNGDTACLLCSLGIDLDDASIAKLDAPLDAIKITPPLSFNDREMKSKHRGNDAMLLNGIGLHFYMQGLYHKATPYFQRCHQIEEKNVVFFINLVLSMKFDNRAPEAFALYQKKKETYPQTIDLESYEASLLLSIDRKEEAAKAFKKLFKEGYRNEEELLQFLNLLNELDRSKEAVEVIDRFLKDNPNSGIQPRRWQHQAYGSDGRYQEALEMARKLATQLPKNLEIQNDLVFALIDAEEHAEAIKLIDRRLEESPEDPFLFYQKGRAHQIAKEYQKAKECYQAALKISPNESVLTEAIAQVSAMLGQGDQSSIQAKIEPVPIPELVSKALTNAGHDSLEERFNVKVLRRITCYSYKKNKPFKTTQYRTIKIFNRGGVEEYKTIRFAFDPTYQRAYINQIEVIDKDGNILSKEDSIESYVSDTSAQDGAMGTTMSTVTATVPGLKPGALLKFAYTIETRSPMDHLPYESQFFATTGAGGGQAVVLSGDLDTMASFHTKDHLQQIQADSFHAWVSSSVPIFRFEPLQPAFHKFLPYVVFGDAKTSWETLARDYLNDIEDRFKPSEAITQLANEITVGLKDEEARADAIMRYVQDQLVYQAIEFGRRARIPSLPEFIAKNRYGDCKDHSLLARQLLRATGIPAHLTLVHTATPVIPDVPSLDQFNHMILYLPTIRSGTYFDGTGKQISVQRTSPIELVGKKVLVLDGSPDSLDVIPFDSKIKHSLDSHRTIQPSIKNNEILVDETLEFAGSIASAIRGYLLGSNEADWNSKLEQFLGTQNRLSIQTLKAEDLENNDKPLLLKMTYTIKGTLKANDDRYEAPLPSIWETFYLSTNRSGSRYSPFEIMVPMKLTSNVTLKLPENCILIGQPWITKNSSSDTIKHTLTSKSKTTLHSVVEVTRGIYPAEQYQDYANRLSEAVDDIESKIILKLAQ